MQHAEITFRSCGHSLDFVTSIANSELLHQNSISATAMYIKIFPKSMKVELDWAKRYKISMRHSWPGASKPGEPGGTAPPHFFWKWYVSLFLPKLISGNNIQPPPLWKSFQRPYSQLRKSIICFQQFDYLCARWHIYYFAYLQNCLPEYWLRCADFSVYMQVFTLSINANKQNNGIQETFAKKGLVLKVRRAKKVSALGETSFLKKIANIHHVLNLAQGLVVKVS